MKDNRILSNHVDCRAALDTPVLLKTAKLVCPQIAVYILLHHMKRLHIDRPGESGFGLPTTSYPDCVTLTLLNSQLCIVKTRELTC